MSKNLDIARSYTDSELNTLFAPLASPTFTGTPTLNGEALVKLSSDGLRIEKSNDASIKNQCTAWVNFDVTTTPPTIRDSYNVSSVVRVATGRHSITVVDLDDNISVVATASGYDGSYNAGYVKINSISNGVIVLDTMWDVGAFYNPSKICVQIFGGKL